MQYKLQDMGALCRPYSAGDLLNMQQDERPSRIKMVRRQCMASPVKRYTPLSDSHIPNSAYHHVDEAEGYYIVEGDESVIFYLQTNDTAGMSSFGIWINVSIF